MTAADLGLVLVTVAALAAFVVLLLAVGSMLRSLRELRLTLEALRQEAVPALAEIRDTAAEAGLEVERIDDLLTTAETISANIEGASRIGYLAFRRPFVKVVALCRGIAAGAWRLVGGGRSKRATTADIDQTRRQKRKAA